MEGNYFFWFFFIIYLISSTENANLTWYNQFICAALILISAILVILVSNFSSIMCFLSPLVLFRFQTVLEANLVQYLSAKELLIHQFIVSFYHLNVKTHVLYIFFFSHFRNVFLFVNTLIIKTQCLFSQKYYRIYISSLVLIRSEDRDTCLVNIPTHANAFL